MRFRQHLRHGPPGFGTALLVNMFRAIPDDEADAAVKGIADRHRVAMQAAGPECVLAHPAVAAVMPGASRPIRIAEDRAALDTAAPADLWRGLRRAGLVHSQAPLPFGI